MFFSGHETESKNGTGILVSRKLRHFVTGCNPINDRIMTIRINGNPLPLNIIQVYAPTAQSTKEDIEDFYGILQTTIESISKREILMIQGDWNAKIGNTEQDDHIRHILGKYGLGTRNERGEVLIDFCVSNNLTITNTSFKHHKRRLYTWSSPGDRYRNQIDFITIANRWKSAVTNTRTFPGADCGSDHQLLVADIRVRLKSCGKKAKPLTRLSVLEYDFFQKHSEPKLAELAPKVALMNPEEQWQQFSQKIVSTLNSMAKKPIDKKDWMSEEVWSNISLRKELKRGVRSEKFVGEYSQLTSTIQRQCRRDKNKFLEDICTEIERHAVKYQTADLFRKVRQITRKFKPSSRVIEDKNGNPIHEVAKIAERWREYCEELYKDQIPQHQSTPSLEVTVEEEPYILRSEIEAAIRKLKNNKAPGPDRITAEVLKGLGPNGIMCLHNLCSKIWQTGDWPSDWVHSSILPLHKKGSVRNCNNYRTIALISHASKILLYIINARLRSYLDWQIPQEQAGFVKGRGTREQILNL
ncbi:uncharacterized protein LOC105842911 [Bombyx mori]|uniref:Endonuclease-reverse transcriptase n=1 Tax=Bombyx mori TaxID=7091 RepID=A0A8R2C9P3_BOMMO|nr:uncharacterized protein LOC105842911 [Bombyx mori]